MCWTAAHSLLLFFSNSFSAVLFMHYFHQHHHIKHMYLYVSMFCFKVIVWYFPSLSMLLLFLLTPHPTYSPKDPFAPSDGSTSAAASSGLDLFDLTTVENNNPGSSLDACLSSVVSQSSRSSSPSPLLTSTSSTITTTATISAPIAPTATNSVTDLFSGKWYIKMWVFWPSS